MTATVKKILGTAKRYVLNRINHPAIILIYHRVSNLIEDPQLLSVTPEHFYEQADYLKKNFSLLGIEEFSDYLKNGEPMPPRSVVLTFDDGYADNYCEALPILESLGAQALFYITTSNLDTRYELWWDELERILLGDHALPPYLETYNGTQVIRLSTSGTAERLKSYCSMYPLCKYAAPVERNRMIANLRQSAGISAAGRESHRLMTTKELKHLSDSSSSVVGAHTVNHPVLSILDYEQQQEEIIQSKLFLENLLGYPVQHFSYPYGSKKDYNKESARICHETGFKMVCANFHGQVHSWTNCFELPRILVRNWDKEFFSQYMTKIFKY
ncbi:MAG: polysaccharide deacetylase family protein [Ginsengibacter sp.]